MNPLEQLRQRADTSKLEQEIQLVEKIEQLQATAEKEISVVVQRAETSLNAILSDFKKSSINLSNTAEKCNTSVLGANSAIESIREQSNQSLLQITEDLNQITRQLEAVKPTLATMSEELSQAQVLSSTAQQIKTDLGTLSEVSQTAKEALKMTESRWKFLSYGLMSMLALFLFYQINNSMTVATATERAVERMESQISETNQSLLKANQLAKDTIESLTKQVLLVKARVDQEQQRYNQLLVVSDAVQKKIQLVNAFRILESRISICGLNVCITNDKGQILEVTTIKDRGNGIYQEINR